MKILNKDLIGVVVLFCSTTLFANCPSVVGHSLSDGHLARADQCTYVSNQAHPAAARNPKLCMRGFILTDPHYVLKSCEYSNNRCVCTIVRKQK